MFCLASGHLRVLEKQASDHYDYSDLNFCFWLRIIGSLSLSVFFYSYNRKGETSADDKGRQLTSYQLTKRREAQEEESPPAEARKS